MSRAEGLRLRGPDRPPETQSVQAPARFVGRRILLCLPSGSPAGQAGLSRMQEGRLSRWRDQGCPGLPLLSGQEFTANSSTRLNQTGTVPAHPAWCMRHRVGSLGIEYTMALTCPTNKPLITLWYISCLKAARPKPV